MERRRDRALALLHELRPELASSPKSLAEATGLNPSAVSKITRRERRPSEETLAKLLKPLGFNIAQLDEQIRIQEGITPSAPPVLLPSTVAPPSVDGLLLRFASKSVKISESEILSIDRSVGNAVTSLVLSRPFRSLRSNISGMPIAGAAGVDHPLSTAPLTYMGLKSARDEVRKMRIRGDNTAVLHLEGWRMLHRGPNYALVGSIKEFSTPGDPSLLHDWTSKSRTGALPGLDAKAELTLEQHERLRNQAFGYLNGVTVLHDSETAKRRTERLFEQLRSPESRHSELTAQFVEVPSCSTSLRLLEQGLLKPKTLVALSHDHAWSLVNAKRLSTIALDHPNFLPPLPANLAPDAEFSTTEALTRTIVVRGDGLSEPERDAAASWFRQLGIRLRQSWTSMQGLQTFIMSELAGTGDPGLNFSYQDLQHFIGEQLDLDIDPEPSRVRFTPLAENG